jgi:hypothetical protein
MRDIALDATSRDTSAQPLIGAVSTIVSREQAVENRHLYVKDRPRQILKAE